MLDILAILPGKRRHTASGWYSFNGLCCRYRGHKPDTRGRAGIKFTDETNWNFHCFNCQFKCGFTLGKHFSSNLKLLLNWCGLDELQISKLSFDSFSNRGALEKYSSTLAPAVFDFKETPLPEGSRLLDREIDLTHVAYLNSRGLSAEDYTYYVVDNDPRPRIIVPYYYSGKIVGHTSRFYDHRRPKYISDQQPGYVFNIDAQRPDWQICLLVEGQFDALSINGCAYLGSNISDDQARLLRKLNRRVIVIPDRDRAGMEVCDRALALGYQVSIPDWADGVKDVNDAVLKYGRLPTLLSIIHCASSSKIIVEMKRKKFK